VIGEISSRPLDTQGYSARDLSLTIHSYSRSPGMKNIRQIMAAVSASLHNADLDIAGHLLILCRETDAEAALSEDGVTRYARQRFNIITEPD
jgi:hypothetical protein